MDQDEYFDGDDDLILDDTTLAILDQAEKQYKEAQQQLPAHQQTVGERRPADAPPPGLPPPPKRQKTTHEPSQGLSTVEDDDGLPEISVIGGGSYLFPGAQELAAQLRGSTSHPNGGLSQVPQNLVRNAMPAKPLPPNISVARNGSTSSASSSTATGAALVTGPSSGAQSSKPNASRPKRTSTLNAIQAALEGFVPGLPDTSQASAGTARRSSASAPSRPPRNSALARRNQSPSVSHPQPRPPVNSQRHVTAYVGRNMAPATSTTSPTNRRQSLAGPSRPRVVTPPVQQRQTPPSQPLPSQGQSDRSDRSTRLELHTLKAQLEDLLKAQEETNKALQDAEHARYAKEGEVSILRRNMEKTAKEYAAELARARTAREQAEAAQAQLRKEMAEEKERLKTQYLFKQQELETSRKTPWAVRIKRIENQGLMSPGSPGSPRRYVGATGQKGGTSSVFQTPSHSRFNKSLPNSPERKHTKSADSPPPKKPAKLLGFYNAFEPSPLKASLSFSQASQSTQIKDKGKNRAAPSFDISDAHAEDLFFNPRPTPDDTHARSSPLSSPSEELREDTFVNEIHAQKDSSGPTSSVEPATSSPAADVEMKDESKPAGPPESAEPLQVPDWNREIHRIILTHKHHGSKQQTLQLLINYSPPGSAPSVRTADYSTQSARLLDSLGMAMLKFTHTDDVIQTVEQTLSAMGRVLAAAGSVSTLAALVDLMKILALFVPAFVPLAFSRIDDPGGMDEPPVILLLLCEVIRDYLVPTDGGFDESHTALATEVMGLLEVVCWYTPPELAMRLSVLVRKPGVLSVLINPAQPSWLLCRSLRALTLTASYHALWKQFLSFPLSEPPEAGKALQSGPDKDFTRIPHIEQLASLLIDPSRDSSEGQPLREIILNFVTTLAVAHSDALSLMLNSQAMLPSIVMFLHNLTAPLWEEDEEFMRDAELIQWTVQTMTRTVLLLHYLMANADTTKINLRQKLMHPSRRFSSALWHAFTVSLGRISYAFPPEWTGAENALRLDQICDLARDVLELAVDGPELESIWEAFHIDDNVPAPARTQYDDEETEPRNTLQSVIVIDDD
ncbi:hypothetical protein C8Q78DRAFT_1058470 [Trametes maxima]|nr:hypothetical protein C8Q78DRAFT_1058470 [Trametes maxima]